GVFESSIYSLNIKVIIQHTDKAVGYGKKLFVIFGMCSFTFRHQLPGNRLCQFTQRGALLIRKRARFIVDNAQCAQYKTFRVEQGKTCIETDTTSDDQRVGG